MATGFSEKRSVKQPRSTRRWPYTLLLLASLISLAYCFSGVVMAGSFSISNPEDLVRWRRVAHVYLALYGLSLVGMTVAAVTLVRRTRLAASASQLILSAQLP